MFDVTIYPIIEIDQIKRKVLLWGKKFKDFYYLDSNLNLYPDYKHSAYDLIVGAGALHRFSPNGKLLNDLQRFLNQKKTWYFGSISYDLKNYIENLESDNPDYLNWPLISLVVPEIIITIKNSQLRIICQTNKEFNSKHVLRRILETKIRPSSICAQIDFRPRMSKNDYIKSAQKLIAHIHRGDIYEVNFCQEFYANQKINPTDTFLKLNEVSPTPFSAYIKINNNYLLCASPERFITKKGDMLISQPIKGTAARGNTTSEDYILKESLQNDPKEISENVMIVDLVRNDLSKIAEPKSVKVEELCKIYSFQQVHQMISTISAKVNNVPFTNILRATFPMGSMTGAPKIKAMQLAEKYENSKRGLYSGTVGYIDPEGNFDFNVVIRSLQYNSKIPYLSYMVGSALTALSDPEKEYMECLLKASAIEETIGTKNKC